jgi:signal transduction histidine kinase
MNNYTRKVKILLIDDDEMFLTMLGNILEEEGYEIIKSTTGKGGIDKVKEENPDIVLVDFNLPDGSGLEVSKKIYELSPDISIIMMTGHTDLQIVINAMRQNLQDYLIKPINIEELKVSLNKAIEKQALIRENRELLRNLQEANKYLEKLNLDKNYFLSIVAHDFRNPLTSLKAYLSYSLSAGVKELPQKYIKYLEIMKNEVEYLIKMVNDILDLSQIERGTLKITKTTVNNLNEFIYKIAESMRPVLENKNIEFIVNVEENLPPIEIDTDRINQVIRNLLSNAWKYTPENGKVTLQVRKTQSDDSKEYLEISVSDTGQGIPKEFLDQVFDKYFRAHDQLTKEERSIGLGLAICKEIVNLHNGKIWAESEGLNKGSKFTVLLPYKTNSQD